MKVLKRSEHPISRRQIDSGALRVLSRLYRAGHTAYLVGGSVRDLFLDRTPKDFDIVTSARPAQVRKLFRNCRLIGRRFRLAHVHFSEDEIVEVATFRQQPDPALADDLLLVSDNSFGSPEEDAYRRDFTINALFYSLADHSIIDYVGGVDDIRRRVVRTINDPRIRFQEDPVRMIRAIKFSSKLDFDIDSDTWEALCDSAGAIVKSPLPRVQEEVGRLVDEGASSAAFRLLFQSGLLKHIEPSLYGYLTQTKKMNKWDPDRSLLFKMLASADRLYASDKKASRNIFFAIRLLPFLLEREFFDSSCADTIVRKETGRILSSVSNSRRDAERVGQILLALHRFYLASQSKKLTAPRTFLAKSYFDDALLLYEIFVDAIGEEKDALFWWQEARAKMVASRAPSPLSQNGSSAEQEMQRLKRRHHFRRRKPT